MSERKPIPSISYKRAQAVAIDPTIKLYEEFKNVSVSAMILIKTLLSARDVYENEEYVKRLNNDGELKAELDALLATAALKAKDLADMNQEINEYNAGRSDAADRTLFYTEKGFAVQEITNVLSSELLGAYINVAADYNEFVSEQGRTELKLKEIEKAENDV